MQLIEQLQEQLPPSEAWYNSPEYADSPKYLVKSVDYLAYLLEQAEMVHGTLLDYEEAYDKLLQLAGGDDELIKGDNTYNWGASIDRDINYLILEKSSGAEDLTIYARIHRGGDVRCNYTQGVLLTINRYDFYEAEYNLDNTFTLEVDGKHYQITPRLSEYHDVYCEETGDSTQVYLDDITDKDATKAIREWQEELEK